MKRRFFAISAGLLLGLVLCACEESTVVTEVSESEVVEESTESEETEEVLQEESVTGSVWTCKVTSKVDFPVQSASFYDEQNGITVGTAGQIRYTHDGGATWTRAANDSRCRFGVEIYDGRIVYTVGNNSQNTRSEDGGENFVRVTDFGADEPKECSMLSFCDDNTGIIASAELLALTTDGGQNWTELTPPGYIRAIEMTAADTFYVISEDLTMYKTIDTGATWTETKINLPDGDNYYCDKNNLVFSVDGEDSYTIFCIQGGTKRLHSYSTEDNWATLTENTMPDMEMPPVTKLVSVNLSNDGNIWTLYNLGDSTVYSFFKEQ